MYRFSSQLFILCLASVCWAWPLSNRDQDDGEDSSLVPRSRRGIAIRGAQWPNRVIPYEISNAFDDNAQLNITNAMRTMEQAVTNCIRFRPRISSDETYLKIEKGNECSTRVGYMNWVDRLFSWSHFSTMIVGENCLNEPRLLHELVHVLGFNHEHARPDRDNYVNVIQSNIIPNFTDQSEKQSELLVDTLGSPYNFDSILHYPSFMGNNGSGLPTIKRRQNSSVLIYDADRLSPIDIREIRRYYKCEDYNDQLSSMKSFLFSDDRNWFWTITKIILKCWLAICILHYCCREPRAERRADSSDQPVIQV